MIEFSILSAMDRKGGIGRNNAIPWHEPEDWRRFKNMTLNQIVIMGRKTWESLPDSHRPLPTRTNIVLSRTITELEGATVCSDLNEALELAKGIKLIYVIGGSELYKEAIKHRSCRSLFLTRVKGDFKCDRFFPKITSAYEIVEADSLGDLEFIFYRRKK